MRSSARLTRRRHTHPPPQAHTLTQVHASTPTAWQTTNEDISSSTRRRCRRGWTPKRGGGWVERGWTPLPFQCFAPADSTREISTVPLYASHPRQKFEFRGVLPGLTKTRSAGAAGGAACGASGGAVNAWGQLWLRSRSWAMASNSSEETNSSDRVVSIQNGSSHSRQVTAVRSHTQHIGRRFTSE